MKFDPKLEEARVRDGMMRSNTGDPYGAFRLQGPCGALLYMIACNGDVPDQSIASWEHVSVRREGKNVPNWEEMCFVKDLFWAPEELVVQYHPPRSQYVNNHPTVLHLWRSTQEKFPMPPAILVGDKDRGEITTEKQARELWIEMNDAIGVKRRDYGKAADRARGK
jgi:hypothetical protein